MNDDKKCIFLPIQLYNEAIKGMPDIYQQCSQYTLHVHFHGKLSTKDQHMISIINHI